MSACLASSVPELDSHLSFIDHCCIIAEETNDKLADLWQQQRTLSSTVETQQAAPRAQLSHLNYTLRTLIDTLQQLHVTVAEWRAEEDEEADEAEEHADEEEEEVEVAGGEVQTEVEVEAENENEQPVAPKPLNAHKPRTDYPTAAPDIRPQPPYSTLSTRSILASPSQLGAAPQQHATLQTPTFATPASNSRMRKASGCSDGRSAGKSSNALSARTHPSSGERSTRLPAHRSHPLTHSLTCVVCCRVSISSPATPCWDRLGLSDATRQLLFVRPNSSASGSGSAAGRSSTSSDGSLDSLDELCLSTPLPSSLTHKKDQRLSSDSHCSATSATSPLPPVPTASLAATSF